MKIYHQYSGERCYYFFSLMDNSQYYLIFEINLEDPNNYMFYLEKQYFVNIYKEIELYEFIFNEELFNKIFNKEVKWIDPFVFKYYLEIKEKLINLRKGLNY